MPPRPRHLLLLLALTAPAQQPADLVNPMIGTAADGQTYPSTGVPFAMTEWTPQTRAGEPKCVAPYYFADTRLQGFRGSHFISGSCTQDYGSFTVMPLLSPDRLDAAGRASTYSHGREHATPYRYAVDLLSTGIHAELTGTLRSGLMTFRFPAGAKTGWIDLENNLRLGHGALTIDPARREITGSNPAYRIYIGNGQPAGFSGYFVLQFQQPFTAGGTWVEAPTASQTGSSTGTERHPNALTQTAEAQPLGAFVSVPLPPDRTVRIRIGTSFTSLAEARRNLAAEIPDYDLDAAANRARDAWNQQLGKIQIAGRSSGRTIFYTALYHAMLAPRTVSDLSGSYPRFAAGTPTQAPTEHAQGFTCYDDYSIWDTFRAVHPLLTLLDPNRDRDMVQSLLAKGQQGGFLPIFPAWSSYTSEMTGDHAGAIIADAYVKGIRGFDAEAAFQLMLKNATQEPTDPALYRDGRGRRALESYLHYGYIPLEDHVPYAYHRDEQVSRTLDYAFDDFEVGVMAQALGHPAQAAAFAQRAQNWRNVIDPAVGFARGRHADGSWITPFNPAAPATYITEATPYIDTFFVPQDIPALIATLGGNDGFLRKLDGLFAANLYDQGNEPSHHIAYLYDDAGDPSRTQLHVHDLLTRLYTDTPAGLSGNDDAGQMSAWYVFSALGFYPVTPGTPRYSLGTPHFDDVLFHTPAGTTLHLHAPGAESGKFYVRGIRLNGHLLHRTYLLHSEILAGGDLTFKMSGHPAQP